MAELSFFGYRHGRSFAHGLDVRCKLASLVLLTSAVVAAAPAAMAPMSLGALLLWVLLRMPLRTLGGEMAAFLVFLLFVFGARAVTTPGTPWLAWGMLILTREGIAAGAVVAWRLMMIVVLGLVFITTTRPADLKVAVQWLLGPIPFVPARRAATMVGLVVRFVPVLHQQIGDIRNALAARAGIRRRLSLRRIRFLVLPTLRRVVLAADQLALAMTARGYQEKRTDPDLRAGPGDGLALAVAGAILVATLII